MSRYLMRKETLVGGGEAFLPVQLSYTSFFHFPPSPLGFLVHLVREISQYRPWEAMASWKW